MKQLARVGEDYIYPLPVSLGRGSCFQRIQGCQSVDGAWFERTDAGRFVTDDATVRGLMATNRRPMAFVPGSSTSPTSCLTVVSSAFARVRGVSLLRNGFSISLSNRLSPFYSSLLSPAGICWPNPPAASCPLHQPGHLHRAHGGVELASAGQASRRRVPGLRPRRGEREDPQGHSQARDHDLRLFAAGVSEAKKQITSQRASAAAAERSLLFPSCLSFSCSPFPFASSLLHPQVSARGCSGI